MGAGACSSAGQSGCLLSSGSRVRILPGAPSGKPRSAASCVLDCSPRSTGPGGGPGTRSADRGNQGSPDGSPDRPSRHSPEVAASSSTRSPDDPRATPQICCDQANLGHLRPGRRMYQHGRARLCPDERLPQPRPNDAPGDGCESDECHRCHAGRTGHSPWRQHGR